MASSIFVPDFLSLSLAIIRPSVVQALSSRCVGVPACECGATLGFHVAHHPRAVNCLAQIPALSSFPALSS
jgi:hypothetical protein